jgi:hypothetical protein
MGRGTFDRNPRDERGELERYMAHVASRLREKNEVSRTQVCHMVSVVIVARRSHGAQVLEYYVVARLLQSTWVTSIPSPAIETVDKGEETLRRAQGERKKSFKNNPPTAQAELVEASFRRKSTVSIGSGKRLVVPVNPVQLAVLDYIRDRMIVLTGMR